MYVPHAKTATPPIAQSSHVGMVRNGRSRGAFDSAPVGTQLIVTIESESTMKHMSRDGNPKCSSWAPGSIG